MFNFWIVSYDASGTVYDVRQIGAERRKTALLLATRRARMLKRDAARMGVKASAKVFAFDARDPNLVEAGAPLYVVA